MALSRNQELCQKHSYELFLVWSQARILAGEPCSILRMLTTQSLRQSFIDSAVATLGLEWSSDLSRRMVENQILQALVEGRVLVHRDDSFDQPSNMELAS